MIEPIQVRKKPVTIQAIRYTGDNLKEVLEFVGKHKNFDTWFPTWDAYEKRVKAQYGLFKVFTPEGVMHAKPGDWILRGVQGEFYPCKHEIFMQTYDLNPCP